MEKTKALILRLHNKQSQKCRVLRHRLRLAESVVIRQILSSKVPVLLSRRNASFLLDLSSEKSITIRFPNVHSQDSYQQFEFKNRRSDDYCHVVLFIVSVLAQTRFNGYFKST